MRKTTSSFIISKLKESKNGYLFLKTGIKCADGVKEKYYAF